MDEMTLQVDSNVNAPSMSRSHLETMKPSLGARYDDVVLVVSELVSNSVRHGMTNGIGIKVTAESDMIRVEVTDEGPGFSVNAPRGDGMGLSIVEKLADSWGMRDGNERFTVWAELSSSPR
jgi:anti-sigma regulatory factor (Ser/Thr protein kinase)